MNRLPVELRCKLLDTVLENEDVRGYGELSCASRQWESLSRSRRHYIIVYDYQGHPQDRPVTIPEDNTRYATADEAFYSGLNHFRGNHCDLAYYCVRVWAVHLNAKGESHMIRPLSYINRPTFWITP